MSLDLTQFEGHTPGPLDIIAHEEGYFISDGEREIAFTYTEKDAMLFLKAPELLTEVKRLREALEYYADEKNYFPRSLLMLAREKDIRLAPIYGELGEIAREALKC